MQSLTRALETSRLLLRPPSYCDLSFAQELYARPEMKPGAGERETEPPARIARRFRLEIRHWQDFGFGRYLIERDGNPIGFAGITLNGPVAGLNLSYHLNPDHWGRGLAQEAVAAILDAAEADHGRATVGAVVHPGNHASRRVLHKAGFRFCAAVQLGGCDWLFHRRDGAEDAAVLTAAHPTACAVRTAA
ncbi:GNAT family N-acetyltransferase [Martelella sp. HB161492]|uniref:GNAT family N-acetyltransferase n=1 Tax=Martelella sp. HB161492 TaxID=2720726 RepID=UPI0015915A31|nr:GNAT family N-acetyltransferase [Martelella sp. HB161492]